MKKILTSAIIFLLLISAFSIIATQVKAEASSLGTCDTVPSIEKTKQIIRWVNDTVIGSYDYYVPYRLSSLETLAYGSYVRIVGQRTTTTVDIEGVGSFLLNAGEMVEFDLPAGTQIRSDYPLTIQVYDDYWCDWDNMFVPPVQEWGKDYWYAGLRTFAWAGSPWPKEGEHYLFITSAFDGTHVEIDVDHDGVPEKTYDLNKGDAIAYGVKSIWVNKGAGGYDVADDPRAGAHILSNNPIMVHAWATHEYYFGSGYLLLPTEALGTDYYVPFVPCPLPDASWDDYDKILIVGTQANTFVSIDENNDGVPELTQTINAGERMIYPDVAKPTPFHSGTHVSSDKPIAVVYSSPEGIHYWDGGATQIVPKESALTEYWNTVSEDTYNYKNIHSFGDSYVLIFAFEPNTIVNIDKNNDGIIDEIYTTNPGTELKYEVFDAGYHIYSDKPIFAAEVWWYEAGGEIELLGYKLKLKVGIKIIQPVTGDTFWIEAEPEPVMPSITAKVKVVGITPDPTAITKFTWEAECIYKAQVWTPIFDAKGYYTGNYEYKIETFKHHFDPKTLEGGTWDIGFEDVFCGGDLKIKVKAIIEGKEYSDSITVFIKGVNPSKDAIKKSLSEFDDPEPILSNEFKQAICYKESRFLQFYEYADKRGYPLFGSPGGYGLMQIDVPPNYFWISLLKKYNGNPTKVIEELRKYQNDLMWNWKKNIDAGLRKILDEKSATKKLEKEGKPPIFSEDSSKRQEMFERNVACRYNSGNDYYCWNAKTGKWEVNNPIPRSGVIGYGDGKTTAFAGRLKRRPIVPNSIKITAKVKGDVVIIRDDGTGKLSNDGVTGTINYETGEWTLIFTKPPDASTEIYIEYKYFNLGVLYADSVMEIKQDILDGKI